MAGILIRGPPPSYCKIAEVPGGLGNNRDSFKLKLAFYKLARPTVADNQLFDTPLSQNERQIAIQTIIAAGGVGLPIATTGQSFIMMDPVGAGWGQRYPRVSRQLSVKKRIGRRGFHYDPICTKEECFSSNYTETSEMDPKCLTHKGDEIGYAMVEYGSHDAAGNLTQVGQIFMSYHFDPDQRQRHFEVALSVRRKPPGSLIRDLQFDNEEAARKTFVVWQTTRFLQSLNDPRLKFTSKCVSFANGLEQEMLNELTSHRLRLTATPWPGYVPFPFGTRLYPTDRLENFVNDDTGALYIYADERVVYGGQSLENKARRLLLNDSLIEYALSFMSFCPIAAVPKGDLLKMEAHLIVCIYLGYLLGLRNPFLLHLSQTRPYCLNLEAITSFFDNNSWILINNFMKCIFSHDVSLVSF